MPDEDAEFQNEGKAAGFTPAQLKFLDEWFTGYGHSHEIADVDGLEEALEGEVEDFDDEDQGVG
jgi:hypothetical protein